MTGLWGVTLVRNEEDILSYTLSHLLAEGVEGFVIKDQDSTDSTPDILREFQKTAGVPVFIISAPPHTGYCQSARMTSSAHFAGDQGAEYILPFDADELWYSLDGRRIIDVLRGLDFRLQKVQQYYHYCTTKDDASIKNPYLRLRWREPEWARWSKSIFKFVPGCIIGGGQHQIFYENHEEITQNHASSIRIRHLPARSFEQMVGKIVRHGQAMDYQYPNDHAWGGDGPVHRILYRAWQEQGEAPLRRVWEKNEDGPMSIGLGLVQDPVYRGMVEDPAPYRGKE